MSLAAQQLLIALLLIAYGSFFIAASIRPTSRYLRYAYWNWFGFLRRRVLGRPRPTIFERTSAAIFGAMMVAAGAFVASLHLS